MSVSVIGGALAGGRIPEGAEVIFSCRSDANPSEVTYRWYINEELVIGDHTTEMVSVRLIHVCMRMEKNAHRMLAGCLLCC